MQAGTYGQWGALLAGDGDVVYPTGYGKIVTGVSYMSTYNKNVIGV